MLTSTVITATWIRATMSLGDCGGSSGSFEENPQEKIEWHEFWWPCLFHHIKQASELKQGCDYSLFKKGILPMWEDDANKRGGRWLINLEKKHRGHDLNNYWLEVLLCLIGEAFDDYHEDVCGAVVNIRAKGDKIGIWTSDALKSQSVVEIGRKIKTRLNINPNMPIGYQIHKDTMAKSGSVTKNTYTV
uniref:eIF-4F 25 kDa subunit n=1 Tax=Timema shepardi TaxID=629360 RepID=A0A7R9AX66_TIMSH|nr:unnamed protein product [Timema shepardi]